MRRSLSKWVWVSGLAIGALSLPTYATITVDGTLNESDYGSSAPGTSALATQTINTSFGDNTVATGATSGSELDAAYGVVENSTLYLFIAGNIQNNSNIFQLFIDDGRTGGQNTLANIPNTAGSLYHMDGSVFSPGFNATYALEINETKATNASNGTVYFDQYNLITNTASYIGSFAATGGVGNSSETGSTLSTIQAGLNDNNIAGVVGDANGGAANQTNAQAVNTGLEIAIPLSVLGNPTTGIEVMADMNGGSDSGPSNQFLPGLAAGTPSVKKGSNPYFLTTTDFTFANTSNEYFTVPNNVIPNGLWVPTGGGSWGTASNWSNNLIPDAAGASASFSSATGGSDITLDAATRTVGFISFNSTSSYSIDPGSNSSNTLVMDNGSSTATISDAGGVHEITANMQLNSNTLVSGPNHGDIVYLLGNISGNGGLTTVASTIMGGNFNIFSAIVLYGNNTYSGPTVIQAGELQLGSSTALPVGTALTMDSPSPHGVLDLNANNATVSSITDNGNSVAIINDGYGTSTFTYAGTNANPSTFDGDISDTSGQGEGTTSLVIASGSLTLTGANSYLGTTTINSGATLALSSATSAGTTLEGNGDITNNGTLLINDIVAAGNNLYGTGSTTVNANMILYVNNFTQGSLVNNGSVTIAGSGTVGNISGTGTLNINNQMQLKAGTGLSQQGGLSISGTLDITNNALVIAFGSNSDPLSTIVGYIKSGYDNGKWDGSGLISTTAATTPGTAIGYADGNTDTGTAAAAGTILIRYTWLGDLNLDGAVTSSDLATMTADSGMTNADWAQGDMNYDGVVNADDFALLALGAADSHGATIALPEPASAALLAAPLLALRRRRSA